MKNIKIFIILIIKKLEKFSSIFFEKATFLDKFFKYFFVTFILIFYLIFKQYFVTGMGGDDGRFYMFYPTKYYEGQNINNKLFPIGTENSTQYLSNTLYVLSSLEKLGFGYKDFYFLIFFLGFYFFYLSLKEIKNFYNFEGPLSNYFIFFLSLLYPANPLVVDQVWNNHWASIFTIVGTPLIFLVFLKLIFKNLKYIEIFFYNLFFTALSIYFISVVHLQVTLIFILTMTLFYFLNKKNDFKYFITRSIAIIFVFLGTNSYWILGTISGLRNITNNASLDVSGEMEYYKTINNIDFLFLGFNKVNGIINDDLLFRVAYIFFSLIILFSIFISTKNTYLSVFKNKKQYDFLLIGTFACLLLVGYFQTISLTKIGSDLFIFATKILHSLAGLRNYINKVPPTYSLVLLTFIFISYTKLPTKKYLFSILFILGTILFSLVSLRELVLLKDFKFNIPEGYKRTIVFDEETNELLNYLKSDSSIQRTAFFPLSEGPYDTIINSEKKDFFRGLSPSFVFLGIDSLNSMHYVEGNSYLDKSFKTQNFLEMEPENILFKLKFLGVNKIIFNNDIDLNKTAIWSYPKTGKYSLLKQELKKNYKLVFETKDKKFSVYDLNYNIIQFKKFLYKLENESTLDLYSIDYDDSTFSFDTLPNEKFSFLTSHEKNFTTFTDLPLNIYTDEFNNTIKLKILDSIKPQTFSNTEKIYHINNNKGNLLRFVISSPVNFVTVRAAIDGENSNCIKRVFDAEKNCEMFKDILPQNVNGNYVYSVKFEETSPGDIYVLFRNNNPDKFNTEEIKPVFYSTNVKNFKYNPFSDNERSKYLSKYFVKNNLSIEYQLPKIIESSRVSSNTYKVKLELEDRKLPIILILKNLYSENWVVEGKFIQQYSKFKADSMFNGWIIEPNGKTDTLELTIKVKDTNYAKLFQDLNLFMLILSIVVVTSYLFLQFLDWKKSEN
jgi:hypothetical protein